MSLLVLLIVKLTIYKADSIENCKTCTVSLKALQLIGGEIQKEKERYRNILKYTNEAGEAEAIRLKVPG